MAVFLFLQSTAAVCAAPDTDSVLKAVSGYCLNDELYAFIQIKNGYDMDSFTANLQSDAVRAAGERFLVPVTETSTIVRYVLMVDMTGSMRKYADEVDAFVDALMETEKLEAFYTVAAFGEYFEVVGENMTDRNAVKRVLGGLEYAEKLTNPYTGIESALTYLDGCARGSGDLIHLVVITDGDPDLGMEDEEESRRMESALAESAAAKIQNAPEIIVSTICTEQWDADCFDALSAGRGIHEMIDDDQDAAAAGEKMADYVDSLYRIDFKLSAAPETERFDVTLRLRGNDLNGQLAMFDVSMEGLPDLKLFSGHAQENPGMEEPDGSGGLGIEGVFGGADEDREEPGSAGGEKPENGNQEEPGEDTDGPGKDTDGTGDEGSDRSGKEGADESEGEGTGGQENGSPDGAGGEKTGESVEEGVGDIEGGDMSMTDGGRQEDTQRMLWIAGICAAVIIGGVILILLVRKRNSGRSSGQPYAQNRQEQAAAMPAKGAAAGGVNTGAGTNTGGLRLTMRLEVYSGNCVNRPAAVCLTDSLVIGSAPECDLVFRDTDMSPQNSRVFIKDQMIYIEDMDSSWGTALGGMRIQGQNRLRSGDVISIGNVEFSFKF